MWPGISGAFVIFQRRCKRQSLCTTRTGTFFILFPGPWTLATTQGPLQIYTPAKQTLYPLPSALKNVEHSTFSRGFPIGSQMLPNVLDNLSSRGESEEFSLSLLLELRNLLICSTAFKTFLSTKCNLSHFPFSSRVGGIFDIWRRVFGTVSICKWFFGIIGIYFRSWGTIPVWSRYLHLYQWPKHIFIFPWAFSI